MSGDSVAEFKDGKITRGEMYEWLEVRGISKDSTLKKKSAQKTKLRQLALDILTVKEAEKEGFDKSDEFLKKLTNSKREFYAGYMQKQISKEGKFSEEAVTVKLIKLIVQNFKMVDKKRKEITGKELEDAIKLKKDTAFSILKEYQSGAKFEELAKKYSDDFTKKNGGLAEYITPDMREPEFAQTVFKMNKGEYTKEPLKAGNAFYIVLFEDKTVITDDNIDSIIKDKNKSAAMRRRLVGRGITSHVEKLKKQNDVQVNYDLIGKGNPAAVIFKVGDKILTAKELDTYVEKIYDKSRLPNKKPIDINAKKNAAERMITEELLARELASTNPEKNESFTKEWSHYYKYVLSNEYKHSKVIGQITVSDQETKDEYEKNKNRSYVKRELNGKNVKQSFYPFNDVKVKITQMLINKKKTFAIKTWEEKILSDNNFRILEDELEGK